MNEKIKELMLEAGFAAPELAGRANKFAELLVQECADLAYSYNIYGRGRAWNLIIKEHFGIAIADTDLPPYLRSTGVDK
jgi:hypothetical protein